MLGKMTAGTECCKKTRMKEGVCDCLSWHILGALWDVQWPSYSGMDLMWTAFFL